MHSNKYRILAFMNAFSQGRSGGDMVFVEIAKRLLKDYDFTLVTSYLGSQLCIDNNLKINFLLTTKEQSFSSVIFIYIKRIIKGIEMSFKVKKPDLILSTSDILPDVIPSLFLKIKFRKVCWVQHIFHINPSTRYVSHFSQRLSFFLIKRFADIIVVDNSLLKKELVRIGFNKNKINVNYPGINLEYLGKVESAKKTYTGVFMAQLRKSKGIIDLIRIWKRVCNRLPNAKLAIIGKGSEDIIVELKEEIKKLDLEKNITILGFLPTEAAFSTIKASKIFVFPSHEEGFGIAPLEAQALGVPVVAYNLPVFEEVFPTGMIKVEKHDINKFAKRIVGVIENQDYKVILSKEALENAQRFDWDKTASTEHEIFNNVLNNGLM